MRSALARSGVAAGVVTLALTPVAAADTIRLSVGPGDVAGNNNSFNPATSEDGRVIAFPSDASNLVAGDTNNVRDVFVRDTGRGTTERVSVNTAGVQANGGSIFPVISGDGRFVAFQSGANNLGGDRNGAPDIFLRDRTAGTTERISLNMAGGLTGNGPSTMPSISEDGRYVAFTSAAANLVLGDTNGVPDVFVRDRATGVTTRISVTSLGGQANGASPKAVISADGRFVAFASDATNLVPGDTNGHRDIFVHDRQTGTTVRVSTSSTGAQAHNDSFNPSISADGRYVAFSSDAGNLVSGDKNRWRDIFVHNVSSGATERVSVGVGSAESNGASDNPTLSGDGRMVTFGSIASNLVPSDTNKRDDTFLRDRSTDVTERVSITTTGGQSNGASANPTISQDGQVVAFDSLATNLVSGDSNGFRDVFLRRRPRPVIGRAVNLVPVSGKVLVSVPVGRRAHAAATVPGIKGRKFVPLSDARSLPVGSLLDARKGAVSLSSATDTRGHTQSGIFSAGVFEVLQSRRRSQKGLTELRLKGSSFRSCRPRARRARAGEAVAQAARSRRRIRRLRGRAHGRFRTRGRYSAATVRGTSWTVTDRCDGTLTTVARGVVIVRDFRRHRNIRVRRGKHYLARAP